MQMARPCNKAFQAANAARGSTAVARAAAPSRRQVLEGAALLSATFAAPLPALAKTPKGFNSLKDAGDGYQFLYPFGWQEVSVNGVDVVYKDVIEPLESAAVQLVPSDKTTILDFGTPNEVAGTLSTNILSGPSDEVQLIKSEALKDEEGRDYVLFEFIVKTKRYSRHVLASTTVANGKLMLFSTGANERRWNKMQDKLSTAVKSFSAFAVFGK